MKTVKFYAVFLMALGLILTGCTSQTANDTANAAESIDESADPANGTAEGTEETAATEEGITETRALPSLQLVCLPYEHIKDNKLQDVAITLSRYLSEELEPVVSYELDESKEYLLVADITTPDYSSDEEICNLLQAEDLVVELAGNLDFEPSSKITTLTCTAKLKDDVYRSSAHTVIHSKKVSTFFCGTGNRGYTLRYFCSMSATDNDTGLWTAGQFLDCSYDGGAYPYVDFSPDMIDITSNRFLAVYEIKLGKVTEYDTIYIAEDEEETTEEAAEEAEVTE